jgi:hypothetical protein
MYSHLLSLSRLKHDESAPKMMKMTIVEMEAWLLLRNEYAI